MGTTPSWEDLEYKYDLLCCLLEEGQSSSPLPAATATPSSSSSPLLPQGSAPFRTSEPPRRRTPAWAIAMRWCSNTLFLVFLVFIVVPKAMQSKDKEDVFFFVGIFLLSLAFPVMGYGFTSDQP